VLFTYRLWDKQIEEMSDDEISYLHQIEIPTMRALLEMEERGVQIDADYIRHLDNGFGEGISSVVAGIRSVAKDEVNLNSPKQVSRLLLDQAGLKLKSTSAEELKNHAGIPLVKSILRFRELSKLKSTYTSVLAERSDGSSTYRLNARFNQTATNTGRLSSSDPNLQNIPTRTEEGNSIRKGFVAKEGHVLIDVDYSQIEPRLMAHLSGDKALSAIFIEGKDLYDSVSAAVGMPITPESRKISKVLWLAMAYNAGAYKISQTASITFAQAEVFLTRMELAFPQFFYWRSRVIAQAEIDGGVKTIFGRFIKLPVNLAHLGPNYMVQGSAAEIMKLALIETRSLPGVLTVHDEMVFEVEKENAELAAQDIINRMAQVVELSVVLIVKGGIGATWSEAKK
jgi:DNA polymerase-1